MMPRLPASEWLILPQPPDLVGCQNWGKGRTQAEQYEQYGIMATNHLEPKQRRSFYTFHRRGGQL